MRELIRARDLTKIYYSDKAEVVAINHLNLSIYKGEIAVIMGASGSGKSTLLHLLSGLDNCTEGDVTYIEEETETQLNGLSESELAIFRRKAIGFIFQSFNLISNLSLFENVILPGYIIDKNHRRVKKKATGLLRRLNIMHLADSFPSQISQGEQQQGAIARALINSPPIILADEPTGNLNSCTKVNILNLINELNHLNHTVVIVTHDLKTACQGDRILYIKDGRIDGIFDNKQYEHNPIVEKEKIIFKWLSGKGW